MKNTVIILNVDIGNEMHIGTDILADVEEGNGAMEISFMRTPEELDDLIEHLEVLRDKVREAEQKQDDVEPYTVHEDEEDPCKAEDYENPAPKVRVGDRVTGHAPYLGEEKGVVIHLDCPKTSAPLFQTGHLTIRCDDGGECYLDTSTVVVLKRALPPIGAKVRTGPVPALEEEYPTFEGEVVSHWGGNFFDVSNGEDQWGFSTEDEYEVLS
jgi:hypothetical protein